MKIAKKVLAVVMAVAMIAALSAMAFAATPGISAELGTSKKGDAIVTADVLVKDAEGLKTFDGVLVYDPNVLAIKGNIKQGAIFGAYPEVFGATDGANTPVIDGKKEAGKVVFGIMFAQQIFSNAEYNKAIEDNELEGMPAIDTASVVMGTVTFEIKDASAASTVLKFTTLDGEVLAETTVKLKDEPVETKPAEVATTEKATAAEEEKTTNSSTGDDKNTGDNMALAAAAGVVVLAGAAFIISKKRK